MSSNYIFRVLSHAREHHQFGNTFQGILKQTGYAAAGAGFGGLTAGPFGAMLGIMAGAVYGYRNSEDYGSLFSIYQDISADDKENLANEVKRVVGGTSFAEFVDWFKNMDHQRIFMDLLFEFARTQMYNK